MYTTRAPISSVLRPCSRGRGVEPSANPNRSFSSRPTREVPTFTVSFGKQLSAQYHIKEQDSLPLASNSAQNVRSIGKSLPKKRASGATTRPFAGGRQRSPTYNQCRYFHDYFVTHLPSTSMHPDTRSAANPRHNLPRGESSPHSQGGRSPASMGGHSREMTVVRIPLKSAKHHFGALCVRGTRPYNEDTYQAGTIEIPAFAKKMPVSLERSNQQEDHAVPAADGVSGDTQVFYFGVFDGHGGDKCSIWLRDNLHQYLEHSAMRFGLESTLQKSDSKNPESGSNEGNESQTLQRQLVSSWSDTVGGYFRRFKPDFFTPESGGRGYVLKPSVVRNDKLELKSSTSSPDPDSSSSSSSSDSSSPSSSSVESVLTYSFLRADLDFITDKTGLRQAYAAASPASDSVNDDNQPESSSPDEDEEPLGRHTHHSSTPFLGGSTCSIALISTPSTTPFWHPAAPFTIVAAHVGDTRIILCTTSTGAPIALSPTHHPSSPGEASRLRRYAAALTTDSFGEERLSGLANTRAFGDRRSKRIGVSAEPALTLLHAGAAEYSFLVLVSDGVTLALSDQEIVDVIKEARTPEQGARDVTSLATELASGENGDADNATCVCVRLGGWERRSEGGGGSLGTRETREWRKEEANNPRSGRR